VGVIGVFQEDEAGLFWNPEYERTLIWRNQYRSGSKLAELSHINRRRAEWIHDGACSSNVMSAMPHPTSERLPREHP
jgi:hypothetical protein